jgi:hypothetical protein
MIHHQSEERMLPLLSWPLHSEFKVGLLCKPLSNKFKEGSTTFVA